MIHIEQGVAFCQQKYKRKIETLKYASSPAQAQYIVLVPDLIKILLE
jgi:hypothetical protein